jgi:ribonuclease P protein component
MVDRRRKPVPSHQVPPGGRGEAHLPAQQPTPVEAARLPAPDVDARRARHPEGPPGQGSGPAVGLIWSIRDRAVFDRFRTEGRRFRHGPLWCSWIDDDAARPPRVAYALGRGVGGAVVRNRVRRQLRHALADEARTAGLPPGWCLIGAGPGAAVDGAAVRSAVHGLMECVRTGAGR